MEVYIVFIWSWLYQGKWRRTIRENIRIEKMVFLDAGIEDR